MIHVLTNTFQVFPLPAAEGRRVELDMGCGKGRMALELAGRFPDRLVLASDVMLGRLAQVERQAAARGLENLLVLRATSLALVSFLLPPDSVDRVHLLCPDPWPKRRHAARRLVCTDFLCRLRRVLRPGGVLHLSTDHAPYFEDWRRMLDRLPFFEDAPEAVRDVADIRTDFELRWLGLGRPVRHLAVRLGAWRPGKRG